MNINRKVLIAGIAVVVLAAGGIGIAYGVGGESEEQVTGPNAEKAKAAALEQVGGGTVLEVEKQDGDGDGVYEVEVRAPRRLAGRGSRQRPVRLGRNRRG